MGLSCGAVLAGRGQTASGLVTVSLGIDYLGRAAIGDWLAFDTDFVRTGRTLCFAGATVTANGQPIARAPGRQEHQRIKGRAVERGRRYGAGG